MQLDRRSTVLSTGLALTGVFAWFGAASADAFVRGDVDQSSRLDVSDAALVLRFLFAGERGPVTCDDAADADDSGVKDVQKRAVGALYFGGGATAPPSRPPPWRGPRRPLQTTPASTAPLEGRIWTPIHVALY